MPYFVQKKKGKKPYKIVKRSGKVVGSSISKNDAMASIRARWASESGQKMKNA